MRGGVELITALRGAMIGSDTLCNPPLLHTHTHTPAVKDASRNVFTYDSSWVAPESVNLTYWHGDLTYNCPVSGIASFFHKRSRFCLVGIN